LTVTATSALDSASVKQAVATCPAGKKVIATGGAGRITRPGATTSPNRSGSHKIG
jgi:hypothetical protein